MQQSSKQRLQKRITFIIISTNHDFLRYKSSFQYSCLSWSTKNDYDHLCNRNTNANFLQKIKKFEHLQLSSISSIILIEAERSQKSFEKFSKRWVRSKWRRKKKKNAGTHGRREHWPMSLRSIHFGAPLHESYLRTASYFSKSIVFPYPRITNDITNEITGAPLSIFLNNRSTCYLLDVLTKTNKKKKGKGLVITRNERER